MKTTEALLLANYFDQQVKQADFSKRGFGLMLGDDASTGKQLAAAAGDIAGSVFIPGYGTATMGAQAVKDFSKGNYIGGAANVLGAGLSAVPVIGGAAGKAVGIGGNLLAKGISKFSPMIAKGVSSLAGRGAKALPWTGQQVSKMLPGAWGGAQKAVAKGIPNFGGQRIATGMGNLSGAMAKRPGLTTAVGVGGVIGGNMAGEANMAARQAQTDQRTQMSGLMQQMRQRPIMSNPIWAKPY